jgi:large-conductance mechanosensitive channel
VASDREHRTRRDDGLIGQIKAWGPVISVIIGLAIFYGKIEGMPEEVRDLRETVAQNKQDNAVQTEQINTLVRLLTDIRDELRSLK